MTLKHQLSTAARKARHQHYHHQRRRHRAQTKGTQRNRNGALASRQCIANDHHCVDDDHRPGGAGDKVQRQQATQARRRKIYARTACQPLTETLFLLGANDGQSGNHDQQG